MASARPRKEGFRREEKEVISQGAPVDYSFRSIQSLNELEKDRPRAYRVRLTPTRAESLKYLTRSIWLNNNGLANLQGFDKLVTSKLEQPSVLAWIDVSYNNLANVPDEFVNYPNLRILYMHANCINSLISIEKLRKLNHLLTITFHGNPIESIPSYRSHIIHIAATDT
ncbi:hypothetical protein L9F63_015854 [Diploptera punctata]|uniref:Leucine-rich repeat-containing protein 51 n=1 Tax=Diploptera punctata TaxID=6984 RepID=A0AAD8EJE3_DIPPU|nr:hypothetical protein L9F63_015854 [Diploptera punctata]